MKGPRNTFDEFNAFVAGCVSTGSAALLLYLSDSTVGWKNHWDVVLTIAVTGLVGVGSVIAVLHQIKMSKVAEDDQRRRRNYAQRAALSHPLSNILKIQSSAAEELWARSKDIGSKTQMIQPITFATHLPTPEDIAPLVNCISDAENHSANDLSRLVTLLQIQNARIDDELEIICNPNKTTHDVIAIYGRIIDALLIYSRAERLLYYARRNDIEYSKSTIEGRLQTTMLKLSYFDENSDFQKIVERRIETKVIMWFE